MAMVGKRFQRTTSMAQIGPGNSLHAEKAQAAQNYYPQQEGEVGEQPPVKPWEILKNAEAVMMMRMATSGGSTTYEDGSQAAAAANKKKSAQHPHNGVYACSPATSCVGSMPDYYRMSSPRAHAAPVLPTHHFLNACFYCKRRLRPERDIFIYRGDAAFCTEECRYRQILKDEKHS